MSAFYNKFSDRQQSQVDGNSARTAATFVDLATAEWFCHALDGCAQEAAKGAGISDGQLVLSSFGELPVTGDASYWKGITSRNRLFALGQFRAMAEQAVVWANEPGRNVYLSMTVFPLSLAGNKRGSAAQALGVFGLGADLDRDKGCRVRIEDLPLPPTLVISSSREPEENFNLLWLFNRLITVEDARVLARALANVVGDSDGGTADPIHVWRVPGTLNWPKKSKVARGRPLTPQPVRLACLGVSL
jgi:hypothetical protein